jgi:hypothetical protein
MEAELAVYKTEFERVLLQMNRVLASLSTQFPTISSVANEPGFGPKLIAEKIPDNEEPE